jgi:uncharacterized SAM-binding protein YcdF (DUF218 family)
MRKKILLFISLGIIICGSLLFIFRKPLLRGLANYLIVRSELAASDLIVVISGSLPEIHYGIDLFHDGYANHILFLGHFPVELAVLSENPLEVAELSWDEVAAHMAITAGIPAKAVLYSDVFTASTYERAQALVDVAQLNDHHSIIVVCDEIHARRVYNSLNQITTESDFTILLAPTPKDYYPPAYQFDPQSWWRNEAYLIEVFDAYLKLGYYAIKY